MTINSIQLREMVREILREVVPQKIVGLQTVESVRLSNDAELAAFVQRIIEKHDAVKTGQLRFTLAAAPASNTAPLINAKHGNALQGVVTEHMVDRLAGTGVLLLAANAVITPLARDRARKLNLRIERKH